MSITSNQFKSTTVYGVLSNVDDTVNNIPASVFFQRDVSLNGNLLSTGIITQSGTTGYNTLRNSLIGSIAQNIGSTINQTTGTTNFNTLNKTNLTGELNINNGNLNLNNGNLTITNGNIVSSIKQIGSSINNTLANCAITNSLVVAGVNYNTALGLKSDTSYVDTALDLKVNTTDYTTNNTTTNNAIDLKSDKTYVDTALDLKVNTTDYTTNNTTINNAINLKSDKTYVDTALDLKVNTTDFTTNNTTINNAINLKSDKTYVDTALALKQNTITSSSRLNTNLIGTGVISNTELNCLDGVSSNIQTQMNNKLNITDYNSNNTSNIQNLQDQINLKVNITDYNDNNNILNTAIANKLSSITQNPSNGDIFISNSINITNGLTIGGYAVFNNNLICQDELECNGNFLLNGINLNDKLLLKSDKSYVDTQLGLKLNITDYNNNNTNIDNSIALKSNFGIESTENYSFINNIFTYL